MSDNDEPTIEDKQVMIKQDLTMWINTRWLQTMRHRMQKRIGDLPALLKPIEDDLIRTEKMIDMLTEELKTIGNGKA